MRRHPILLALLAALCLPPASAAQEPPPAPSFGDEVDVTEVLLDVLVTDREGNVIVGLAPGDFTVREGDRPVELLDVTFYSNRPQLDAAGSRVRQAESDRYFILFFHDQKRINTEIPGLLARSLDAARRAREWLGTLQLDDHVAVVSYDTSLRVHQDFTLDRSDLQAAVDEAIAGGRSEGNWPSRLPPEDQPSLLRRLPRGNALLRATDTIYEALGEVAAAVEPLVGRKNLVLFSSGFGEINSFGQYVPDARYHQPMVQTLNDANVAVYAVDLFRPGSMHPLSSALSLLSSQTGGRYFGNAVSFEIPLQQVAEETSGYYLLSYRATHPRGSRGFQEVSVSVANPELRVKAREGYRYGG